LQCNVLWFDVKMHCVKSCRPFELFVNEHCELQNEAKMNVTFERGSAWDPSAQSSLHWDERCFCVKNRGASCMECHSIGNDFVTTIARVVPSRTKRLLDVVERAKCAAVISCRRLVLDTVLRDLLHCLWSVGPAATGPMRWEVCLLWMSLDPVSPAWGHSVCSQFLGKLGHCRVMIIKRGIKWSRAKTSSRSHQWAVLVVGSSGDNQMQCHVLPTDWSIPNRIGRQRPQGQCHDLRVSSTEFWSQVGTRDVALKHILAWRLSAFKLWLWVDVKGA